MHVIEIDQFLKNKNEFPVLDTRSPGEYESGHMPGAINLPLFNNDQRAIIGTIYKEEGREKAIKAGLKLIGPKLVDFIEIAESLGSKKLLIHCWRGGMRSSSLAWLLELYGFDIHVLKGGYKSYRNYLLSFFDQPLKLKIVAGTTGSMKTRLLQEMEKNGAQIVDLEGLAHHQGSAFGSHMEEMQPTSEQFQNDILEKFLSFSLEQPIWLEDESFIIGKAHLIAPLYQLMQESPRFHIVVPKEQRLEVLVKGYGSLPKDKLIQSTHDIAKKLGKENCELAIGHIENGEMSQAASIILGYYDKAYGKGLNKKSKNHRTGNPYEFKEPIGGSCFPY
ncbi:tRNA 2-selenouridine(34) synthase MnmH [Cyclobacterium qasimii]|uniref:Selenophosphate-dependent tRNA 2-selenouridine synthase n=1 Tax=Cyclobacterium qasimii M12-11B TaxID=641524 RepID=S7VJ06_9BACT|nr:tRNA 2-selenouridine(34) synthase MnmH [Cyclobacterium qasimii]EPR69497.1 Selenophosphate-dependent tRNA 2-selenouridine synthase [Cyclobacterium qasimii M12-11B]